MISIKVIVELDNEAIGLETFEMNINFNFAVPSMEQEQLASVEICHRGVTALLGPQTHPSWCNQAVENQVLLHESCSNCATLQILNPQATGATSNEFIEMETDGQVEFVELSWPFQSVEDVAGNVARLYFAEDFEGFDGFSNADAAVTIAEVRYVNNNAPLVTFMHSCPIEQKGNDQQKPDTTTTTTAAPTTAATTSTTITTTAPPTTAPPSTTGTTTTGTKTVGTTGTTTTGTTKTVAPATTTTRTTTTTTTTTTTEPCTGECCIFPDWKGASYSKLLEVGPDVAQVRVNVIKTPETVPYTGFLIYPRKKCGGDFINAIKDGRLQWEIMDFDNYYNSTDKYHWHRNDDERSSITLQFQNKNPAQECQDSHLVK